MPRTPEQNGKIRKEKSELIMKFAVIEYYSKGVRGFEMQEVAKAAGIGKGTLYHYFSTKESLLQTIFRKFIDDSIVATETHLFTNDQPMERLYAYMKFQIRHAFKNPENIRFYKNSSEELQLVYSELEVRELLQEMNRKLGEPLIETIEAAIASGDLISIDPWKINHMLWWSLLGATSYYENLKDTTPDDDIISELLSLVLKGILN